LEQRLTDALQKLAPTESKARKDTQTIADHLSLFSRWYYRPEAKRVGEAIFYMPGEEVPTKLILRAISRVFRGTLSNSAAPGPAVIAAPVASPDSR
jgi:hypothetical protein